MTFKEKNSDRKRLPTPNVTRFVTITTNKISKQIDKITNRTDKTKEQSIGPFSESLLGATSFQGLFPLEQGRARIGVLESQRSLSY